MMWTLKWSVAVGLLTLGAMPVQAVTDRQMMEKNCWIEVFDDTKYDADDPHVKVQGPMELSSLKNLQGRNWNGSRCRCCSFRARGIRWPISP